MVEEFGRIHRAIVMRRTHCQHEVKLEFETQRLKSDSSLSLRHT
jgi:hypothetical protein